MFTFPLLESSGIFRNGGLPKMGVVVFEMGGSSLTPLRTMPNILAINAKFMGNQFSLQSFSKSEIKKQNLNLDSSKSDIPTKVIKANSDIFKDILYKYFIDP